MFCPKCRENKFEVRQANAARSLFTKRTVPSCADCGTMLCNDRLASEFDLDGYTPQAQVHDHKLDGLISISTLLTEVSSGQTQVLGTSIQSGGRHISTRTTLVANERDYAFSDQQSRERVGRYDQYPALDDLSANQQSTQRFGVTGNKPSPWPVIALVLALEIVVSIGVYSNRHIEKSNTIRSRTPLIDTRIQAHSAAIKSTPYQVSSIQATQEVRQGQNAH